MRKAPILNAATADRIETHTNHHREADTAIVPAPCLKIKEEFRLHCETKSWADHPMFDLHPSFMEVQAAKAVFMMKLQENRQRTRYQPEAQLYMSPETVVACALAEVWRQGRKYQRDRDNAALRELAGIGVRA
mgnify:CR=1 FL=1